MKKKLTAIVLVSAILPLAACVEDTGATQQPAVGSAYNLSSFEGARAGDGEMGIRELGYELIRTEGLTAYWFNASTGACARIRTSNGRYSDVTMLPAADC